MSCNDFTCGDAEPGATWVGRCVMCWTALHNAEVAKSLGRRWYDPPSASECRHRGPSLTPSQRIPLNLDMGRDWAKCNHPKRPLGDVVCPCKGCGIGCPKFDEEVEMRWMYGVTTVPSRAETTLPKTLASLAAAGFDAPRIRVDADTIGCPGNWWLSMWELWIRDATADRYAIFQDDIVCSRNLRAYLDSCIYPEKVYWNLYTGPENQPLATGEKGWFMSNQMGKGALALVFDNATVKTLLGSRYMLDRFIPDERQPKRHLEALDGGVVSALKRDGVKEMCHSPSLVQHIGKQSTMSSKVWQRDAPNFKGEDFDLLKL